jgi:hypothetical protein
MMEHIPKPWEVVAKLKNGYLEVGNPITEQTVCEVCHYDSAPLIMAAPELLEALKKALVIVKFEGERCDTNETTTNIYQDIIDQCKQAISKVEAGVR